MPDIDLDELRAELDDYAAPESKGGRSAREERVVAGFEDIQRFVDRHGRVPQHGEERDIFERLYAVRLDRLRALEDCRAILLPFDRQGLLGTRVAPEPEDEMDDDALLAALAGVAEPSDVTELRHVRSSAARRAAEEIADHKACADFAAFRPLFERVKRELDAGARASRPFTRDAGFLKADVKAGQFFVLGGQTAYVAEVGEPIKAPNGQVDARLRVVYSNGTESDLLLRSLQRALYKDEAGRRITEPDSGPLFGGEAKDDDAASGTVYVLRSLSDDPAVASHRDVLHKIGVTGGDVRKRVAHARLDPTFLMADVEVVKTYELFNVDRAKLENLIHRIFGAVRLDVTVPDRLGQRIKPREWFLVPLFVIDEAVGRIRDGSITRYVYDPASAALKPATGSPAEG